MWFTFDVPSSTGRDSLCCAVISTMYRGGCGNLVMLCACAFACVFVSVCV